MVRKAISSLLVAVFASLAFLAPDAAVAAGVVGNGTAASCTEAAFTTALTGGGSVTFNCGAAPVTIAITSSKAIRANTTIDGGGLISLSGGEARDLLSVAEGQTLNLLNITIRDTSPGTPFNIGSTLYNSAGTVNLTNVQFINNNRLSIFNGGGTVTITASRFEGNSGSGFGGAISNESRGTLTIRDSTFTGNRAPTSYVGGAIYNNSSSTATIIRSNFVGNSAGGGGAISNFGTMTISDSLFTGNNANNGQGDGGAIDAHTNSNLNIINTTISGNIARRGGGIVASGTSTPVNAATLTNVTLANNSAPADAPNQGGGNMILFGEATITLRNTIVANPAGGSSNCKIESSGTAHYVDGGNNLQYPGTTCSGITSSNPKLGTLADNGGLTLTHAIAADSPARNAANNALCPAFDQRGVVRPQGTTCDIGAFEYGAVPILETLATGCVPQSGGSFTLVVNGSNFIPGPNGSKIVVNGTALPTTFVSPTRLSAVVPAGVLAGAGSSPVPVKVRTAVVDGGESGTRTLGICYAVYVPIVRK